MRKLSTTMELPGQSLSFGNKITCLVSRDMTFFVHKTAFTAQCFVHAPSMHSIRQCRLDEQMISSDKLAYHMQCHDKNRLWKEVYIRNRSKSTLSNYNDGVTGEITIANQWKHHYSSLLNSLSNTAGKDNVC